MRLAQRSGAHPSDDDDPQKQPPSGAKDVKVRVQRSVTRSEERKSLAPPPVPQLAPNGHYAANLKDKSAPPSDKPSDKMGQPNENPKDNSKEDPLKKTQNSQEAPSKSAAPGDTAVNKDEERMLRRVEGYHGYLPREDIAPLLKNRGDYVLRISETEEDGKGGMLKEIILCVLGEQTKDGETKAVLRNMVVSKKEGKYFLNRKKQYASLLDLISHHRATPWTNGKSAVHQGKISFQLITPIPLQKWEFMHRDVTVGEKLGMGAFGEVCRGKLKTKKGFSIDVAIKVTKGDVEISKKKIKELVNEARLVRFFKHKNVVRTYGVAVDKQPLFIILELVGGGSLNNYLRNNAGASSDADRLSMCLGAAMGLQYLHKFNTVHADVAARNCLISPEKMVKISDFGLAFVLNPDETSRKSVITKLPVKWLSPETIHTVAFSLKSDVYSFGILCFEVFSDGEEPYFALSRKDAKALIIKGETVELPPNCPEALKSFLKQRVFAKDPEQRPPMTEVMYALQKCGAVDIGVAPKKT